MRKFISKIFIKRTNNLLMQFIRYFFVGGIAAGVNIGLLFILTEICNINYVISNVIAFIFGLIVNYYLSKKIVFTNDNSINKVFEFIMYAIIGVVGLGIDTLMLWIFTDKFKIYYMLSKIISTIITFVWNFIARKLLYKLFDK